MLSLKKCVLNSKLNRALTSHLSNSISTYEEVRVPVPWGHIAGKWWGPQNKRPILAIHGWQDNAGSFDPLMAYLPENVSVLAIDLPGHGFSSQLPPGFFYHFANYSLFTKRIIEYFKWPKVSLLTHSLGTLSSYVYTVMYPNTVDFLICLDSFQPLTVWSKSIEDIADSLDAFLKYDEVNNKKDEPPSYDLQLMQYKMHQSLGNSISMEGAKHILKRTVAPSTSDGTKYYFTRDTRLKILPYFFWTKEEVIETAPRITCPLLITKASDSPYFDNERLFYTTMGLAKKSSQELQYHKVPGTHHMHLNNPQDLEGVLNPFIKKYYLDKQEEGGGIKPEMKIS